LNVANIILIHGAWQGSWCWRDVALRLRSQGHQITTTDLPGHGDDGRRPEDVTLQDYVDAILRALDSSNEHAILMGHSAGGVWISQAAEVAPDKISALVCVAGELLPNGSTLMQGIEGLHPQYLS
jgi:pimeloyl-ACP methyl ester carboxylesterase